MKSAAKIILTNNKNETLLHLRDNQHSYEGYWALFGGHIDDGETPEEALVREIKEEINYSLNNFDLIQETMVQDFGKVYRFHGMIDVEISQLTLLEGDDFRFFTYEEIKNLKIAPESKKRLVEYYKNNKS